MNEILEVLEELKQEIARLAVEAGAHEDELQKAASIVTDALDVVISRHKEG